MKNTYTFIRHFRKQNCFEGDSLFYNEAEQKFALVNEGEFDDLSRQGWTDHEVGSTSPYKYNNIEDLNHYLRDVFDTEISMEDL